MTSSGRRKCDNLSLDGVKRYFLTISEFNFVFHLMRKSIFQDVSGAKSNKKGLSHLSCVHPVASSARRKRHIRIGRKTGETMQLELEVQYPSISAFALRGSATSCLDLRALDQNQLSSP